MVEMYVAGISKREAKLVDAVNKIFHAEPTSMVMNVLTLLIFAGIAGAAGDDAKKFDALVQGVVDTLNENFKYNQGLQRPS